MGRYTRIPIKKSNTGSQYYKRVIYPNIPRSNQDLYVFTTDEDRYDLLALQYYKSSSLWWVISSANPSICRSKFISWRGGSNSNSIPNTRHYK
jgi:hypothetical protein